MAKLTKKQLASMGKKIIKKAKELQSKSGSKTKTVKVYNLKWRDAVAKAGKQLSKGKQLKLKYR